jgi:uncharacterized protein YecE (DUF72 family)
LIIRGVGAPPDRPPTTGRRTPAVRIGCSGWQYPHWRGVFYPRRLSPRAWLTHYARFFDTVEVNSTFYRLPAAETVRGWREAVPLGFVFAVKASRYLTHLKRLRDAEASLGLLVDRLRLLGPHLGPILYQLPPRWQCDIGRLGAFLDVLPAHLGHAIEFRDPSWYRDEVFRLLEARDVALCVHDLTGCPSPRLAVASFVYVRLHGTAGRYAGSYSLAALRDWAAWLVRETRAGREAWVYFNNDVAGCAPRDARRLGRLLALRRR